jgi:hypothetical protein
MSQASSPARLKFRTIRPRYRGTRPERALDVGPDVVENAAVRRDLASLLEVVAR